MNCPSCGEQANLVSQETEEDYYACPYCECEFKVVIIVKGEKDE